MAQRKKGRKGGAKRKLKACLKRASTARQRGKCLGTYAKRRRRRR